MALIARLAYGGLFCVVLPLVLALWARAAVFERAEEPPDRGWAIHEVVTWP